MPSKPLMGVRDRLHRSNWGIPAILFVLTALVYGPLLPSLGYYWDDWPVINLIRNDGDLWAFFSYNRPLSAWTYALTGPILGIRPLNWHLLTLILRWLTSVGVFWTFKQAWPRHPLKTVSAAMLFTVYPSFTLQPIAVAFSQHFFTYALFVFSLGAMLAARSDHERCRSFTVLAVLGQAAHLLTMEYFWGLELVRPLLLMIHPAAPREGAARRRFVFKAWLPYLVVLSGFLVWRLFLLEIPGGDPNALALLELYRADLLGGLLHSFNLVARDLLHMVYKTWTTSLGPSLIDATDRFLLVSWGLAILTGVLAFLFLKQPAGDTDDDQEPFYATALPVGAAALVVSLLPSWITDNDITVGLFSSRFSIPALFGSSLLLTGVIDLLLRRPHYKPIATAVLVCLAAGVHLRNANDYRWDWVKQERFFRQFSARVPALEDGTAIFSDGAIFRYTASYPTSAALNTVYPLQTEHPAQSYWFFELDDTFGTEMESFVGGIPIEGSLHNLAFSGHSQAGLTIFFEPDTGSCLRVLSPDQADLPFLPELTAAAAQVSVLSRIRLEAAPAGVTLERIFGREDPSVWCILFQQADLALQQGEWETIAGLQQTAADLGLEPNDPFEWLVFVEAHARLGDWDSAGELILEAFRMSDQTRDRPSFCAFWTRIAADDPTDIPAQLECDLVEDS